ncbi:MAG: hypothetical protein HY806_00810 [Nitrospirae bacterium]|nr:hypothetical protein [Nitrospirota bacterium]
MQKRSVNNSSGSPVSIEALMDAIVFKDIKTLRSEVAVRTFKDNELIGQFEGILAFMSPDALNLRIFSSMGNNLMETTMSNGIVQAYVPNTNVLFEGKLPIVSLNDLPEEDHIFRFEELEDRYLLYVFKTDDGVVELASKYFFEKNTLLNTSIYTYMGGMQYMEMRFSDFSGKIPGKMNIVFHPSSVLEITIKNPILNTAIPANYFKPMKHENKTVKTIRYPFSNLISSQ